MCGCEWLSLPSDSVSQRGDESIIVMQHLAFMRSFLSWKDQTRRSTSEEEEDLKIASLVGWVAFVFTSIFFILLSSSQQSSFYVSVRLYQFLELNS